MRSSPIHSSRCGAADADAWARPCTVPLPRPMMLSIRTTASDGVELHWEESGAGTPILFVHEFAGDHRSWAPQVRHFASKHRCIIYAARGYPPSDVPREVDAYSQARAADDALGVLDAAGAEIAHVV